ncbi:ABC transporter substrate-binding protein [Alteribacillus sp. HJP-4]|uniref:ABC transporter substrate-binding protein n=1 Tax=Alteribacillus sp. HJP-4 TaxID=2775394 RepID=UPI0035CCE709
MKKCWLAILSLMFILGACSGGGSGSEEDSSEAESSSGEEVTLRYFHPGVDQPGTREGIEDMIERFESENENVTIELETAGWDDAYQKLVTDLSGGSAPDIFFGGTRWVPTFAAMDALLPLTEQASEHIKLFHDPLQSNVTINDEVYAIPRGFSTRTLIYRTDLIDEPPTTWEELVDTAVEVQENNEDIYGFGVSGASHISTVEQYLNYVYQNNGDVFDEEGNVIINEPEAVEALQFYTDLYRVHEVVPNPVEYNREELPTLFSQGRIAMYVIGPWGRNMMGEEPDNDEFPYDNAPLPEGASKSNIFGSDSIMISNETEYPEEAWDFVEFITQPNEQKQYDLDQGLVPIQKDEMEEEEFHEDPFFSKYVDMIEYGHEAPKPTAWEPFQDIISEAVQNAMEGTDPQEALDEAAEKIEEEDLMPIQE